MQHREERSQAGCLGKGQCLYCKPVAIGKCCTIQGLCYAGLGEKDVLCQLDPFTPGSSHPPGPSLEDQHAMGQAGTQPGKARETTGGFGSYLNRN